MTLRLVTAAEDEWAVCTNDSATIPFGCCDSLGRTLLDVEEMACYKRPRRNRVKDLTCIKKIRYRDQKEGLDALHKIQAKRSRSLAEEDNFTNRREIRAYACDYCRGWHLTSNEPYGSPTTIFAEDSIGNLSYLWEFADVA